MYNWSIRESNTMHTPVCQRHDGNVRIGSSHLHTKIGTILLHVTFPARLDAFLYCQWPGSGPGWSFRPRITSFLHKSRHSRCQYITQVLRYLMQEVSDFLRFCKITYEYFPWEISISAVDWEVVHVRRPWEVAHSERIKMVSTGSFWLYTS